MYNINGVGDVITGRIEQGRLEPGTEVVFLPTHTSSKPCTGRVSTVEMHHKNVDKAGDGDNIGVNIKGLSRDHMPRVGDVLIRNDDDTLKTCKRFTAQIQVLDVPGELKIGYTPIGFVRTGRAACRIVGLSGSWAKRLAAKGRPA